MTILLFIQEVLSTPAIFVGLVAMLGLLLQKSGTQTVVKGTIMTILGFVVLNAGASVVQDAIIPFGNLFQIAFGVEGVVPNNEAVVSLGLSQFAVETASIFALGMVANILLARFSSLKYIFLTGHHSLYMACLITCILKIAGMDGWQLYLAGALILGFVMAFFPWLMNPIIKEVVGDDSVALGHFGSACYWLSGMVGRLFGGKDGSRKGTTTEDVSFPQGLAFLRNNNISIALVMFVCYFVVAAVAVVKVPAEAAEIFGEGNWVLYAITQSITFSAGIYIVLSGVRLLINEIVPAFKGISEKLVPNAKPALDCPIIFTFAPNAVLMGFASSFIGGIVALIVLIAMNHAGLAAALILPGAVVHFFCGATAGVCGNATGGVKGCVVGSFIHGVVVTFLAAGLYPIMGALGFVGTTFSDADFTLVGFLFGMLSQVVNQTVLLAAAAALFVLPIVIYYATGKNKAKTGA